jgi:hypothetical protein
LDRTHKYKLSGSIEIEISETPKKAELSINLTFRGIVIDLRAEYEKAFDPMLLNSDSFSNQIDARDSQ